MAKKTEEEVKATLRKKSVDTLVQMVITLTEENTKLKKEVKERTTAFNVLSAIIKQFSDKK